MPDIPSKTIDKKYLEPSRFVDSDHQAVVAFALAHTRPEMSPTEKAIALYYAVRDGWRYNPYDLNLTEEGLKASHLLTRSHGYCIEKANLLAAAARVHGIPARLGFCNVRNHIGVEKYQQVLNTDVLVFHGYADLYLQGQWVKATPAFNKALCAKLGVAPLEFNGSEDSIFQEYNEQGDQYMEYLHHYGTFEDIPRNLLLQTLQTHYPHLFDLAASGKKSFFTLKY